MEIVIEMIRGILCAKPTRSPPSRSYACLFECERPVERVRVLPLL